MTTKAIAFLATTRPAESRRFYADVLGLRFVEEHAFALVFDAHGTMLRIQKVREAVVAPYTAFGLDVDDLETAVDDLVKKGVTAKRYAHFAQDARGIWTADDGTRVFWFQEPDGNLLSLSQFADSR
jgi:catechol 2,3-dioxygenase-like lactoylglutathione lyase family enzyme